MKPLIAQIDLGNVEDIVLISDVHANLPALDAVLRAIPDDAVIVCAGDLVGYYVEPNEVCELLREKSVLCIKGNHDKYVLGELDYNLERESKYRVVATQQVLTAENREWLSSLPDMLELKVGPANGVEVAGGGSQRAILIAHGSPDSVEEYIYPDTSLEKLRSVEQDCLVLGHTHHPMCRYLDDLMVVNPGSVGQARDRIVGACYATLNSKTGVVEFGRVQYNVGEYQQLLENQGLEKSAIDILSRC